MGTPEKIVSLVSALGSSNRTLSPTLVQLLDEVAGHHGGMIPIHGRLFSQWMHQAYPRECRFPHVSAGADHFDSIQVSHVTVDDRATYKRLELQAAALNSTES